MRDKTFQAKHIPMLEVLGCTMVKVGHADLVQKLQQLYPQAHENVIYAKLYKADDQGLIDYGTTIRWPWLTDKGFALILSRTDGPTCVRY